MNARRRVGHTASACLAIIALAACGIGLRSDRAAIGGGPEQATSQARIVYVSTVTALATANANTAPSEPCTCDSTAK